MAINRRLSIAIDRLMGNIHRATLADTGRWRFSAGKFVIHWIPVDPPVIRQCLVQNFYSKAFTLKLSALLSRLPGNYDDDETACNSLIIKQFDFSLASLGVESIEAFERQIATHCWFLLANSRSHIAADH